MSAPAVDQALLDLLEGGERVDGDAEVVDGAPAADAAPLADDRLGRHLEHVEGAAAAHVEDEHAGVVALGLHRKVTSAPNTSAVPVGEAVEVGGQRGHVVEAGGDGHGRLLAARGRRR